MNQYTDGIENELNLDGKEIFICMRNNKINKE